jgi:hypothetical protein
MRLPSRCLLGLLAVIAATTAASPQSDNPLDGAQSHDFTVLTMAPDGRWGAATHPEINRAVATAIAKCQAMPGPPIGCGAQLSSIRAGWTLGFRCGSHNILVAERDLADAERRAHYREMELRSIYDPAMPPCVRLVTITPGGFIQVPPRPTIVVAE